MKSLFFCSNDFKLKMNQTNLCNQKITQSNFKLAPMNQPIRPQRFIQNQIKAESIKKNKLLVPEIEKANKIDELLSTCSPDKMNKVLSKKTIATISIKNPESEPSQIARFKKVSNQMRMNEIFLANVDQNKQFLLKSLSDKNNQSDGLQNYDEGSLKIKELTQQSHHYQIYDQIKLKHDGIRQTIHQAMPLH